MVNCYYICGQGLSHLWSLLHLWSIITFVASTNQKNSMLKKFVFKKITIEKPNSSKLNRYVNKATKLYHAPYKCNKKRDPKIIRLNKMAIPKRAYLLSYYKVMKLKCKARRYLSLFSCNCVSHSYDQLCEFQTK